MTTATSNGKPKPPSPYALARTRREAARARREELRLGEEEGQLVDVEQVETVWSHVIGCFRSRMLAIPSKLAPQLTNQKEAYQVKAVLEAAIHEALRELSELGRATRRPTPRRKTRS